MEGGAEENPTCKVFLGMAERSPKPFLTACAKLCSLLGARKSVSLAAAGWGILLLAFSLVFWLRLENPTYIVALKCVPLKTELCF